ncbi:MAG: ATP synthase F0 subunit C [Oscillospiraceae bacterium]|nr:ATP synthase F0 subunit C [Oscillospiraceae bacterium]
MDPLSFVFGAAQLSAAIALLNGIATTVGQGKIGAAAIEAIARQPESAGSVRSTMLITLGVAETSGIYGLVIALLLLFQNPLIALYLQLAG